MAYLNSCTELDDLGKGRFRHIHHIKPIAYLENGVYKLASTNVVAAAGGTYTHAVMTASMGVRIGDDGKYAIHPTRELARYVAFGGPQVKVGGKWTVVPFAKPVRKNNTVIWTQKQADLKLTHIGHGLKHEMWLKNGYVPEDNLIAVAVNLVGLTRSGSTLLADGKPVARIQAPVVYDAANRLDTRPIKWGVTSRDGQPYIVYTLPDLTGMAAPVVDPTLTLQPDAAAGEDAQLDSSNPTWNYGTREFLGMRPGNRHSLIRFDLSSIPSGAIPVSSVLSLFAIQATSNAGNLTGFRVLPANAGWAEGTKNAALAGAGECCWDALAADGAGGVTTAWAGGAGCFASGVDISAVAVGDVVWPTGGAAGDQLDLPISNAEMTSLLSANNGLVCWRTGSGYDWPTVYSSDHATASYRPKLVVDYTLPASGGGMLLLGVG